jgi:hypothetical protein
MWIIKPQKITKTAVLKDKMLSAQERIPSH